MAKVWSDVNKWVLVKAGRQSEELASDHPCLYRNMSNGD
jgi:hypothetical protein